jgi:hypothetical protein
MPGRAKVQTLVYGAATAYNVKKLAAGIRYRRIPASRGFSALALAVALPPSATLSVRTPRLPSRHFGNRPCRDQSKEGVVRREGRTQLKLHVLQLGGLPRGLHFPGAVHNVLGALAFQEWGMREFGQ